MSFSAAGGANSAIPNALAGLRGHLEARKARREGKEGREKGKKGRDRRNGREHPRPARSKFLVTALLTVLSVFS